MHAEVVLFVKHENQRQSNVNTVERKYRRGAFCAFCREKRCDLSECFDLILILTIEHFKYMAVHGTALLTGALWSISFLDLLHHGQFYTGCSDMTLNCITNYFTENMDVQQTGFKI